jgi:hypothetical protein
MAQSYACFHAQDNFPGWDGALARSRMPAIKLFQFEMQERARAVRPGILIWVRHWVAHQQPFLDAAARSPAEADVPVVGFVLTGVVWTAHGRGSNFLHQLRRVFFRARWGRGWGEI